MNCNFSEILYLSKPHQTPCSVSTRLILIIELYNINGQTKDYTTLLIKIFLGLKVYQT